MKHRIFLLGLDGASWNLLDRLLAAGVMPNLQRLCEEGVRATLASTVPPITPVAWSTLMTGVSPGKHGVFGFLTRTSADSYLQRPVNRLDLQVPTIFDYYRVAGRLISLNLPMSYPATPVSGLMVSGMMTPLSDLARAEYPTGLMDRFQRAGIDYVIDPKFQVGADLQPHEMMAGWQRAGGEFVTQLSRITRDRMRAVHLLLAEEAWEIFICVIVGTDRIQHIGWDRLMQENGTPPEPALAAYYAEVDEQIGGLMAALSPGDALLVVSDHGFTACRGAFYTNEWLAQNGWLTPSRSERNHLVALKRLLKRLGLRRSFLERLVGQRRVSRLHLVMGDVDRKRTVASLGSAFGIRLNLRGREIQGCLDPGEADRLRLEIRERLLALTDPQGRRVMDRVYFAEELYHGPAVADAPDIVFIFREEANYSAYAGDLGKGVFAETPFKSGDHRIDGIFAAWGGGIRKLAAEERFEIQDVLPTLLHLNGRSVPGVCDGRVLTEILTDPGEVAYDREWKRFLDARQQLTYDADQEAEIKARLQALGYMSGDD